jgi:hypothetical protein
MEENNKKNNNIRNSNLYRYLCIDKFINNEINEIKKCRMN